MVFTSATIHCPSPQTFRMWMLHLVRSYHEVLGACVHSFRRSPVPDSISFRSDSWPRSIFPCVTASQDACGKALRCSCPCCALCCWCLTEHANFHCALGGGKTQGFPVRFLKSAIPWLWRTNQGSRSQFNLQWRTHSVSR